MYARKNEEEAVVHAARLAADMSHLTNKVNVSADTSAVGRRTDEIICGSLLEKRSDIWNRSAPRGEHESLEVETTHQQFERSSGRLSGANGS